MKRIVLVALIAVLGLPMAAAAQTSASGGDWERFYARFEYLMWWMKDQPQPVPLVVNGATLTSPGSTLLMGANDVGFGAQNGSRATMGAWFTDDRAWGMEIGGFYMANGSESRLIHGSGSPGESSLRIPFVNANTGAESSTFLSLAGAFSGTAVQTMTNTLWGAEGSVLATLYSEGPWRVEALGGFRYMKLNERWGFETSSPDLSGGGVFVTSDVFDATNDFYGLLLGIRGRYQGSRWMFDATVKVGLGDMHQNVSIVGVLVTNQATPNNLTVYRGGYFAQSTNIGSHSRDVFGFVPEARLSVGFRITDWAAIVVGYTFLYAQDVVRPGNQIDRVINPSGSPSFTPIAIQTPPVGPQRPAFKFQSSDFWAHGLTAGINLSF